MEETYDGYVNKAYSNSIDSTKISTIMELGARYGEESIQLSDQYPGAKIHVFECNPYVLSATREKLSNHHKIRLHEIAVSDKNAEVLFYPARDNVGASSLFVATLGKWWGDYPPIKIQTQRLDAYFKDNDISSIDLICADIQGGEMNAFIGMGEYFKNVKYIITEIPTNTETYRGAPNRNTLLDFLYKNDFEILFQSPVSNPYEHNILFGRKKVESIR